MDDIELIKKPISEENPAGEDVKYDEEYEIIDAEISKLSSVSATSEPDWDKIIKLSKNILQNKSKHILVSTYLTYALFKTDGINGFANGIKILSTLLENYWDTLYPPLRRMKGRKSAIQWLIDKSVKELESIDTIEIKQDEKDDFLNDLKKVDDFLNENIEDAPLFYNLINMLNSKLLCEEELKESEKSDTNNDKNMDDKSDGLALGEDLNENFTKVSSVLSSVVSQMIETKDYRAELFIINRAIIHSDINELPFAQNSETMINPPDSQEIESINRLFSDKKYEDLLWACESRTGSYLFWLDLHYFVCESLKNLGFEQSADAILNQMIIFTKKLPNIENLTFSDSTPFANRATKKWLKSKENQGVSSSTENEDEEKLDCSMKSIDILSQKMKKADSVKQEVLYNIKICECLAQNKDETLIKAFTQRLVNTIDNHDVLRWDPMLALRAYSVSLECLNLVRSEVDVEIISSLLEKVAILQPSKISELR
jgi:type VI secretion system protein VasJ